MCFILAINAAACILLGRYHKLIIRLSRCNISIVATAAHKKRLWTAESWSGAHVYKTRWCCGVPTPFAPLLLLQSTPTQNGTLRRADFTVIMMHPQEVFPFLLKLLLSVYVCMCAQSWRRGADCAPRQLSFLGPRLNGSWNATLRGY
jgi:hypothetical protein